MDTRAMSKAKIEYSKLESSGSDTKAEECVRLRTLQLIDRSVADPALPAKLQETENYMYLKLCTDAFLLP